MNACTIDAEWQIARNKTYTSAAEYLLQLLTHIYRDNIALDERVAKECNTHIVAADKFIDESIQTRNARCIEILDWRLMLVGLNLQLFAKDLSRLWQTIGCDNPLIACRCHLLQRINRLGCRLLKLLVKTGKVRHKLSRQLLLRLALLAQIRQDIHLLRRQAKDLERWHKA